MAKTHIVSPWTGPELYKNITQYCDTFGTPTQVITEDAVIFGQSVISYDTFEQKLHPVIDTQTEHSSVCNILSFDFVIVEYLSPSGNSKSYLLFVSSATFI